MAQVIKLKRSAVAGKTPQTSSLQLGELAVNTTDGKIYLHRSSSSDDSIQSVLTTDATITGSLKLSGSQHISGSTNVMDDLTYGGNLSASIGSTSSFDRFTSLGTSSIGFLIASGSNFATFTHQTGSFASGSDVQQILDESGSYLVDTDTGSLGKVTLVSDITGSITSTASFGKIFGDGSDLDNVADPAAISGSFQGGGSNLISGSIISTGSFGKIFGDGSSLSNVADPDAISGSFQGGGSNTISGSLISTASFGTLELVNSHGFVRSTETGSFASGSNVQGILDTYASGSDVQGILDTYASGSDVQGILDTYASGSDLQIIQAESASYVVSTNTGSFASGSDLHQILAESSSYVVDSDTGSLHQVLAESASYLNNDTTSSFGAVSMDSTLFVQGDITTSGSVIAQQFRTEFVSESIIFASGSTKFGDDATDKHRFSGSIEITGDVSGSITSTASFGKIFGDGGNLSNVADPDAISGSFQGGGSTNISGSILSTGSFGRIVGDTISVSNTIFASGSDVQTISDTYASGSDLHQILAESSSYVVESETGSFVVNSQTSSFASGSNVQTILDTYASGSDLHQILAESSSYVLESETGSFVVNSQTSSFASGSDLQIIQAESASYVVSTNTGSFLQNSDSASFQSTIITSSLEITGSITIDGDESAINLTTDGLRKFQIAKNTADDFKINRYDGAGSFVDQPITIASSSGITTIKDQLVRTGGVTFLQGAGSTTDGVGVYNDMKVGIGTGTTAIGDEKFLVAGDTGITGSLFVSSSITTSEILNNTGTLKVSQSVSDGDIEISVNDGGTTKKALTIDGSDAGSVILGNNLRMADNQKIRLGTANDFNLYHDGTHTYVENTTGHILMRNQSHGNKIHFGTENSSGVLEYVLNVTGTHTVGIGTSITGDEKLLVMGDVGVTGSLSVSSSIKSITGNYTGNVSGALGNTGSFDRLEGITLNATISPFASGSDVSQIQAQTGSYATGSDLHQFLAESSSYVVESETGSFVVNSQTGSFSSGSDLQIIKAESASYVVSTNTGSFLQNTDTASLGATTIDSTLFVQGNIATSGSITAQEYIVNSSVTNTTQSFSSGSTIFGDTIDDTHKFTGSLFVSGGINLLDDPEGNASQITLGASQDFKILHHTGGSDNRLESNGVNFLLTREGVDRFRMNEFGIVINEPGNDVNFRVEGDNDANLLMADAGTDHIAIGKSAASGDEKLYVGGDVGITGSLNVSGSITSNQTPNVHSLSGSLHVSGGAGGTLHLSSSTSTPMIQFHQSSSDAAILLQTDEYGADLWKVIEFSDKNHSGLLIGQTFSTATGDSIRVRAGGNGDCDVEHHLSDRSFMVTDLNDVTTAHAKIDSSGIHTSHSIDVDKTGSFGRVNFDGVDGHTFIQETADDTLKIFVGGEAKMEFAEGSENIFMQANNYNFRDASFNSSFKIEANNHLLSGSLTSTGSFGKIDAVNNIDLPDNGNIRFGASQDMNIVHNGTDSFVDNYTGDLKIRNNANDKDIIFQTDDNSGGVTNYIQLDGSELRATFNVNTRFNDSKEIQVGSAADLQIYHDGTHNYFDINNGNIYFRDDADNNIFLIYREGNGVQLTEGNITIPGTSKVIFDGATSGHSHIAESAADIMDFTVGGDLMLRLDEASNKAIVPQSRLIVSGSDLWSTGGAGGSTDNVVTLQLGRMVDSPNNPLVRFYTDDNNDRLEYNILRYHGKHTFTRGSAAGGHVKMAEIFGDSHTKFEMYHQSSNKSGGSATGSRVIQLFASTGSSDQSYIRSGGGLAIETGSVVIGGTSATNSKLNVKSEGSSQSTLRIDADDARGASRFALQIVDDDSNSRGSVSISTTSGPSIIATGDISSSITSTGSFGRVETTTAGIEIGSPSSAKNYPLQVEGHAYVKGPDGWNGNGDLAIVALGSHVSNENFGVGYKYGTGMIMSIYKSGGNGSFGSSTADAMTIADTTGDITLLAGADITGSIASTASFGKIVADQYSLATLAEVSGGLTSTGSFGRVEAVGTIKASGQMEIGSNSNFLTNQLKVSDGTRDIRLNANHGSEAVVGTVGAHDFNIMTGNTFRITIDGSDGGVQTSGSIVPFSDNAVDLGSASKRFQDVFAVQTTVGAVFETGLRSKGIGKEETGTIVVWRNGGLVPCDKSEDTMVMGVVKQGKDEPIVMGAEPVLVTGDVKEGDFITTSTKQGHGKKLENGYLLKKEMFGKVIAQALEDSSGESSLIKCMIRKM